MKQAFEDKPHGALEAGKARVTFSGFFLAGVLMSFLGPMLPAWGFHLKSDFTTAGLHFFTMALGVLASVAASQRLLPRKGISFLLVTASGTACVALLYLAAVPPPMAVWWRMGGVFLIGVSSGLLLSALFNAITPVYRLDPAATVNIAGILFVLGSLTISILVAGTFYVYTVGSILFLLALIPALFAVMFARSRIGSGLSVNWTNWRRAVRDFRSPSAALFALVLFFQFGNEWSVAGWLSIFLIQRIGINPASALVLLALFWLLLLFGRIFAQFLLRRVSHRRFLVVSVLCALFGCLILSMTKTVFGAVFGILFVAGGFAAIYPLVVIKMHGLIPSFHPTLFFGMFALAMTGGLLAPGTLSFAADWLGIGVLMLLPLAGTLVVFALLILIAFEAKVSGRIAST